MARLRFVTVLAWAIAATFASAAPISGAGSSAAYPLYVKWAEEYAKGHPLELDYDPAGSAAGIRMISARQVDFGATDVPPSAEELRDADLLVFPTAVTGVVPVVNLPGLRGARLRLTGEVLADVFMGRVTRWNEPAIAKLNPGIALPDLPITRVVRNDGSGTTWVLADYLSKVSDTWRERMGRRIELGWPEGVVAVQGASKVVTILRSTPGSISYLPFTRQVASGLAYVDLRNRDGRFVTAGASGFREAVNRSPWRTTARFEESLADMPGVASWPITTGTFVLMPRKVSNVERARAAVHFFVWGLLKADMHTNSAEVVSLPDKMQARVYRELATLTDSMGRLLGMPSVQ